ncbi:MAG: hypothetical protein QM790_05965 [Nibricoccus sp.]
MVRPLTAAETPIVISLLKAMLVEAGLGAWEIDVWLKKAEARIAAQYRVGATCYFLKQIAGEPAGVIGALLGEESSFLAIKSLRYGVLVDEYVLAPHRGQNCERELREAAAAWIEQNAAAVARNVPANACRLAVMSHGGKL